MEEIAFLRDRADQLTKMRAKQARMGNKTNVADIDAQLEDITERTQWLAADIVQVCGYPCVYAYYVCVCINIYIHAYAFTYTYVCTCKHAYIYIYIYT